jgi:hypothetical protein
MVFIKRTGEFMVLKSFDRIRDGPELAELRGVEQRHELYTKGTKSTKQNSDTLYAFVPFCGFSLRREAAAVFVG